MDKNAPIVEFQSVDISNGDMLVVSSFTFSLFQGEFAYLTGKVGSGKTSIIRTMIGENPVVNGSARVCSFDLNKLKRKQIPYLRREIGVVFQDFQLLLDRSVEDNLKFVLTSTGWNNKQKISERINEVLTQVGLTSKAHKMPHQLSGGEQQRVAIARALLNEPKLILADEPTGNLDSETADSIMKLLREINSTIGTAVLMVTHNTSLIKEYPGRVLVCANNECKEIE